MPRSRIQVQDVVAACAGDPQALALVAQLGEALVARSQKRPALSRRSVVMKNGA
jgi:hypothetical protein